MTCIDFYLTLHADIDECTLGTDDCVEGLATCTDTPGSFTCACNPGYAGDGVVECTGKSVWCPLAAETCHMRMFMFDNEWFNIHKVLILKCWI